MFKLPIFQLTVELTIGFFALFAVTKFTRKSQINQITPFDFISAIVLGELLGNAIYDEKVRIWSVIYALVLWGTLMVIIEKITQKFRKTRKLLEGEPAIIIRNGQIDFEVIKKEKLDINELLSLLRQKDAFSIREIEFAILEQSGNISVLKKSKYETPVAEDLNLPYKPVYLPITLILDGEILKDNLQAIGFDETWLFNQISMFGMKNKEDVFYADWKQNEGIHVVPRNNSIT
ncbi:DUF421 domain-containing protein [Clostridium formicaceticum]|uniref:DUF421 domain-containing protein n=1 Tax=Clostridium formicaceticum TaxID=1497 RepID=A0AAC9RM20_9CLOT|nr:DUF421 domain-containing protein [Clostridium formicaceticum]AOY77909.1 hypothetical protein BJL90_19810 [Clostridium formicaceticum]ARE88526.1 hypothetical protein CLFO_29320 [Clostridium formicaceticum]